MFERKRKIDLSGTRISINYDTLDWNGFCFNDDEVTSACHRFIWMFTDVVKQLNAGAKRMMPIKPVSESFIRGLIIIK